MIGEDHGYLADLQIQTKEEDPYATEIAHFIECARANRTPIASGKQVLELQRLVAAILPFVATRSLWRRTRELVIRRPGYGVSRPP